MSIFHLCLSLVGVLAGVQSVSAQAPRASNTLSMENLIDLGKDDLNDFWSREFTSAGWMYAAPYTLYPYDFSYETACGPAEPGNAFYCLTERNIYYDINSMREVCDSDEFGDFGMLTILAHEWSHAIQPQLAGRPGTCCDHVQGAASRLFRRSLRAIS